MQHLPLGEFSRSKKEKFSQTSTILAIMSRSWEPVDKAPSHWNQKRTDGQAPSALPFLHFFDKNKARYFELGIFILPQKLL